MHWSTFSPLLLLRKLNNAQCLPRQLLPVADQVPIPLPHPPHLQVVKSMVPDYNAFVPEAKEIWLGRMETKTKSKK